MARELITSWHDYQSAIDRLLAIATGKVRIYDEDLQMIKPDAPARHMQLQRLLHAGHRESLQIALRHSDALLRDTPGLLKLLSTYGHIAAARQTPEHLAHLRDCLILVDDRHGLIRFDRDQARSKLLIDEPDEINIYTRRFSEIWNEGGDEISATTPGL
jgi:hypothetical protein